MILVIVLQILLNLSPNIFKVYLKILDLKDLIILPLLWRVDLL